MAEAQSSSSETPHRRYSKGVAKRLDDIQSAVQDLSLAVLAVLAQQQSNKDQRECR